eukprot:10702288-Heterocapsa_arctica.AAC.1
MSRQKAREDQQHMADEEHGNEDTNDVQTTQEEHQLDGGDLTASQITGKRKEDVEPKSTDCSEVEHINENNKQQSYHTDHKVDAKKKDIYILESPVKNESN